MKDKNNKKQSKVDKLQKDFELAQLLEKQKIKQEPKKFIRFWKWIWYFLSFPFKWLFVNIRDFRTFICILIAFSITSASVWIWYLLAIITGINTDIAKWFWGVGSAVWLWWLSPLGSPYILITISLGIGIKTIFNKIKKKKGC